MKNIVSIYDGNEKDINNIKIIFAKHEGDSKAYMFELPQDINANKGDVLLVNTIKGSAIAVAVTKPIEIHISQLSDFVDVYGAYLPLKKVKGAITNEFYNLICERIDKKITEELAKTIQDTIRSRTFGPPF